MFSKLIIASSFIFPIAGCNGNSEITSIVFDNNYQSVWKVGEIDFSELKFFVTYSNGSIEEVPVTIDMIEETDLYKFYKVGDWKVKINLNNKYSSYVDFVITENKFDDSICLKDEIVAYDGKSHSLSIQGPLPEGTNVYFPDGNSFTVASTTPYEVNCVISKDGYKSKNLTGYLTITKSEYSKELLEKIEFNNLECVYDGSEKKIEAKNIPFDCTIDYSIENENKTVMHGNSAVNAGEYTITADIKCSNVNYLEIPSIVAKLKINKATYKMDNIVFKDAVFDYEEDTEHKVTLANEKDLPAGVKVRYENNIQVDVGEYTALAYFDVDSNHEPIEPMSSTLSIVPKVLDLSGIKVEKIQSVKFDGEAKEFFVDVPSYINVEKKYYNSKNQLVDEPTDVGKYTVQLSYQVSNGLNPNNYTLENLPSDNGLLSIEKKILDLSKINFENQSFSFDGNPHEFKFSYEEEVDGETVVCNLPEELNIVTKYYKDGVELAGLPTEIADYVVSFDMQFKDKLNGKDINPNNYTIINKPSKNGILKITKNKIDLSRVVTSDQNRTYNDGKEIFYELSGIPESVIATINYYKNGVQVNHVYEVGNYNVLITYELAEGYSPDIYEIVGAPVNTPTLYVQKKTINMAGVVPKDIKVAHTGQGISYSLDNISNYGTVSKYVDVVLEYFNKNDGSKIPEGSYPSEVGQYSIEISFKLNSSYSDQSYTLVNVYKYSANMVIE